MKSMWFNNSTGRKRLINLLSYKHDILHAKGRMAPKVELRKQKAKLCPKSP